jgi:hypothetical protein
MFNKKLEKRIEKLEKQNVKLNEEVIKLKYKEPMFSYADYNWRSSNNPYGDYCYREIPIDKVINLILDKMNLEVKSEPAQKEKFVLGKKEGK